MPLAQILLDFKGNVAQCDNLIANAHRMSGAPPVPLFPAVDREQITVAAFLNLFIAWEAFLEFALSEYMTGSVTINGSIPVKYVSPLHAEAAREFVIGVRPYFDYANHDNVKKSSRCIFKMAILSSHISAVYILN